MRFIRSVYDDQCHENQIIRTDIDNAVSEIIGREGYVSCRNGSLSAVIVIFSRTGKNIVRFTFAVMFMIP